MRFLTVLISAVLSLCAPASAQDLPDWISAEGRFSLGVTDRVPGADVFLFGDADLRLSFGQFGAELGIYGRADALDTPHETYGNLTYDLGANTRIAVGVPRPAYDGFARSALEGPFPSLGVDRAAITRSAATQGAMFQGWLPLGLSIEGRDGNLSYGFSFHSGNGTPTVIGLGAGTTLGAWAFSGAVEAVDGEISAKGQVTREFGGFLGGIGYYAPGSPGASEFLETFATAQPFDRLGVTAVVQVPLDGGAAAGGVSARYEMSNSTGLSLGVATDAGFDATYNAFIDFRF